jgi:competence protein ComEC
MLIDAGVNTNKEAVLDNLEKYGVSEIEYAVLTHYHADHIGAAADVINGYRVNNVIMPDATATSATFDNMLSALEAHNETNVIEGKAGYKFSVCNVEFEILSPSDTEGLDANETSLVLLMKYGEVKMLFMGDAAKSNEEVILNNYGSSYIKADLIKIGHHGSSSSSSEVFLKAVSPEYAVISCGEGNTYGHPHQETLETLAFLGITLFRTDTQGEITAVTDGSSLSLKSSAGNEG